MNRKTWEHIEGCLLGALLGRAAIPGKYLDQLELVDLIAEIAEDLYHLVE